MIYRLLPLLVLYFAPLFCVSGQVNRPPASGTESFNFKRAEKLYLEGELYVKYQDNYQFELITDEQTGLPIIPGFDLETSKQYGVTAVKATFKNNNNVKLQQTLRIYFSETGKAAELIKLTEAKQFIEYAERVPALYIDYTPNDLGTNSASGQWALYKIKAREAWDIGKGDSKITVAIVDNGVSVYHPDLYDNIWKNPGEIAGNGVDDDNNGYIDDIYGWDVSDDDNTVSHTSNNFNHGTHVAGCAGAVSDNNTGIASIGFNISLIAVKCVPNSQNNVNLLPNGYEGIAYAASAGADIINCSWSGGGISQTGQNVVSDALAKGCLIVGAASNDGVNQQRFPAAISGVLAVASTESNDTKSGFSNYGTWVDVCAPGASINSTLSPNTYGVQSGTSMAAPIVAGLLGLMKSLNPNLTNAQLEQCLLDNTDDISAQNPSFTGLIGRGRINAQKAMQCVAQTLATAPQAFISSDVTVVCPNNPVQFYASSLKGTPTAYKWYFPGGTPSSSTLQNPIVTYAAKGKYDVTLVLTNSNGKDSITATDYMEAAAEGRQVIFARNFESGTLADNGFTVENPDNSITWEIINAIGNTGSTKSARMSFYSYPAIGERDALITPVIDLTTNAEALLEMRHSYRRQNNNGQDSLIIYVSTDGGSTFPHKVAAFSENGSYSFATNSNIATSFNPTTPNDWCYETLVGQSCISVDLSDFYGEANVKIKLEAYNGYGNNLYIDDIKITANCAAYNDKKPKSAFKTSTTTFCGQETVKYTNATEYFPTSYEWIFEGGLPATSTDRHPEVTYTSDGKWDVTLITGNGFGYDTLVMKDYIDALPAPVVTVTAGKTTLCKKESTTLTATGAITYEWGPVFGISGTSGDSVLVNPPTSVAYFVIGTGANGCKTKTTINITVLPGPGVVNISRVGDSLYASNIQPDWTMQWLHNGLPINGAETVQYRPSQHGNYALKVTDSMGCSSTSGNYLYIPFSVYIPDEERITVYPNPASDVLYVVNETPFHDLTAMVINSIGQVVTETKLAGNLSPIDITSLSAGIYYIKISNPEGEVTKKIIVNRQ